MDIQDDTQDKSNDDGALPTFKDKPNHLSNGGLIEIDDKSVVKLPESKNEMDQEKEVE